MITKKKVTKKNWSIKLISLFLIFSFSISNFALPQASADTPNSFAPLSAVQFLQTLDLPTALGSVKSIYVPEGTNVAARDSLGVILIQDAHAVPAAQVSIQKILGFLSQQKGMRLTGVEGASGRLDPLLFRAFPDAAVLEQVFHEYLNRGELSGAVTAAVLNQDKMSYFGVEDAELYEQEINFFLESVRERQKKLPAFEALRNGLERLKAREYGPELLELDRRLKNFEVNPQKFYELLEWISGFSKKTGKKFVAPARVSALLADWEKESSRDSESIRLEIQTLSKRVRKELADNAAALKSFASGEQDYKTERLDAAAYARYLEEFGRSHGIELPFSAALKHLMGKSALLETLAGEEFFSEFQSYVETIKQFLFRSEAGRALDQLDRRLGRLEKFSRLELSFEDWQEVKGQRLAPGRQASVLENKLGILEAELADERSPFARFYKIAEKRDAALLANLCRRVKNEKSGVSALVTGGFHTRGLTQALEEAGISYALVAPAIREIPEKIAYLDQMHGRVSWQDYFQIENGRVRVDEAFTRATVKRLLDVLEKQTGNRPPAQFLKKWRDLLIQELAREGRLAEAGRYTRFLDKILILQMGSAAAKNYRREWLRRVQGFVQSLRRLDAEGRMTPQNLARLMKQPTATAWPSVMALVRSNVPAAWISERPLPEPSKPEIKTSKPPTKTETGPVPSGLRVVPPSSKSGWEFSNRFALNPVVSGAALGLEFRKGILKAAYARRFRSEVRGWDLIENPPSSSVNLALRFYRGTRTGKWIELQIGDKRFAVGREDYNRFVAHDRPVFAAPMARKLDKLEEVTSGPAIFEVVQTEKAGRTKTEYEPVYDFEISNLIWAAFEFFHQYFSVQFQPATRFELLSGAGKKDVFGMVYQLLAKDASASGNFLNFRVNYGKEFVGLEADGVGWYLVNLTSGEIQDVKSQRLQNAPSADFRKIWHYLGAYLPIYLNDRVYGRFRAEKPVKVQSPDNLPVDLFRWTRSQFDFPEAPQANQGRSEIRSPSMPVPEIKAMVFDWDGTLSETRIEAAEAIRDLMLLFYDRAFPSRRMAPERKDFSEKVLLLESRLQGIRVREAFYDDYLPLLRSEGVRIDEDTAKQTLVDFSKTFSVIEPIRGHYRNAAEAFSAKTAGTIFAALESYMVVNRVHGRPLRYLPGGEHVIPHYASYGLPIYIVTGIPDEFIEFRIPETLQTVIEKSGGRIYGADRTKLEVMEQLTERFGAASILSVGDGPSEAEAAQKTGQVFVALAHSSEEAGLLATFQPYEIRTHLEEFPVWAGQRFNFRPGVERSEIRVPVAFADEEGHLYAPAMPSLVHYNIGHPLDGWNRQIDHAIEVSGPPRMIWGSGVEPDPQVRGKIEAAFLALEKRMTESLDEIIERETASQNVSPASHPLARQKQLMIEQLGTSIRHTRRHLNIEVLAPNPDHSPLLVLNKSNDEYLFADFRYDKHEGQGTLLMREDALDLPAEELAEVFYMAYKMMASAQGWPAKPAIPYEESFVHAFAAEIQRQILPGMSKIFPVGLTGNSYLGDRIEAELLPSTFGMEERPGTQIVRVSDSVPLGWDPARAVRVDLPAGLAPGTLGFLKPLWEAMDETARDKIKRYASWNGVTVSSKDISGRAQTVPGIVFRVGNRTYGLRFKGNGFQDEWATPHPPAMLRYAGSGSPMMRMVVDAFGRLSHEIRTGQPLGGSLRESRDREIEMSEKFIRAGFQAAPAAGWIDRADEFRGLPTGALAQLVPADAGFRLRQELINRTRRSLVFYHRKDVKNLRRELTELGDLIEAFSSHLRDLHDAGFLHGYPHTDNFTRLENGEFFNHDLDNARVKKGMSLDEALIRQFEDFRTAYMSMRDTLTGLFMDFYEEMAGETGRPEDVPRLRPLPERFARGYLRGRASGIEKKYLDFQAVRDLRMVQAREERLVRSDHPLIAALREVIEETDHLRPLQINEEEVKDHPPQTYPFPVSYEVAVSELVRLYKNFHEFEVQVFEDSNPFPGSSTIGEVLQDLARGPEKSRYVPFVDENGLHVTLRDSSLAAKLGVRRSELRTGPTFTQAHFPRLANSLVFSRQFEAGYPTDLLDAIAREDGEELSDIIAQTSVTGGLGALMPDLGEGWGAIKMPVSMILPVWDQIKKYKKSPSEDYAGGVADYVIAKTLEHDGDTRLEFKINLKLTPEFKEAARVRNSKAQTIFEDNEANHKEIKVHVYRWFYPEHQTPLYLLDAFYVNENGKKVHVFDEVYSDDESVNQGAPRDPLWRDIHMAIYQQASQKLIRSLKDKDENQETNLILIDNEVFTSLPARDLPEAKRFTINHTVFRPGLYEPSEISYELFDFPESLRDRIAKNGKISIADYAAATYHRITGVGLIEHLPALERNIFPAMDHKLKGYYDGGLVRSSNGVFFPKWQSPEKRTLIEQYKKKLSVPEPEFQLPAEATDKSFFEIMNLPENEALLREFQMRAEAVDAKNVAVFLLWLKEKQMKIGRSDWLGQTLEIYRARSGRLEAGDAGQTARNFRARVEEAVQRNDDSLWAELLKDHRTLIDVLMEDPISVNVRRQVPYKGPDKWMEMLDTVLREAAKEVFRETSKEVILSDLEQLVGTHHVPEHRRGEFWDLIHAIRSRPDPTWPEDLERAFDLWKDALLGAESFSSIRKQLPMTQAVQKFASSIGREVIGGRIFDAAYDRWDNLVGGGLYNFERIKKLITALGVEGRVTTIENYNYREAHLMFQAAASSVLLSDENLEAAGTSQAKVKANGGEIEGVFGGTNPELWTIVNTATGEEINVLNQNGRPAISYGQLKEHLDSAFVGSRWEILDGELVEYAPLDEERSHQEGGGRRPSARSLLKGLEKLYQRAQNGDVRRQRRYQALASSWRVNILYQAMAHGFMLEEMLREQEERRDLFNRVRYEIDDAEKIFSENVSRFGWWKEGGKFGMESGPGLPGLLDAFHKIRTWGERNERGRFAATALEYHATRVNGDPEDKRGDIFKYIMPLLGELSEGARPLQEKMNDLAARSAASTDARDKVELNLVAIDLIDEYLNRLASRVFEEYLQAVAYEKKKPIQKILQNKLLKPLIARYLDHHPGVMPLRTSDAQIRAFLYPMPDGRRLLIALNLGAIAAYETSTGLMKAWGEVYYDENFAKLLVPHAKSKPYVMYQIQDVKEGINYKPRSIPELGESMSLGIPEPIGLQILQLEPLEAKMISALNGTLGPRSGDSVNSAIAYLRTQIEKVAEEGGDFGTLLQDIVYLNPKIAEHFFSSEGIPPVMLLVATLAPQYLSTIRNWNPDVCELLEKMLANEEDRLVFEKGAVATYTPSRSGALVFSKVLDGKRALVGIQFSVDPRNVHPDDRVYSHVKNLGESGVGLNLSREATYEVSDALFGDRRYGEYAGSFLLSDWQFGLPYPYEGRREEWRKHDPYSFLRGQILWITARPGSARSEIRALEYEDDLLRYRAAHGEIPRGYMFVLRLPQEKRPAQVFWTSDVTGWKASPVPMDPVKDGLWAVVIPEDKAGAGRKIFKFMARYADGGEEWLTGDYPTQGEGATQNAVADIKEDSPFFQAAMARRVLAPVKLQPSPVARLVTSIPISSLRSKDPEKDPGIGKFTDLTIEVLETEGTTLAHLLPHHEISPWDQGPYGAIDFFSVNELNINWAQVAEILNHPKGPLFLKKLAAPASKRSRIDYDDVRRREEEVKAEAYQRLLEMKGERLEQFEQFVKTWDDLWLKDYAEFMALLEITGKPLPEWQEGDEARARRHPDFSRRVGMHKYAQWVGTEQQLRPLFRGIEERDGMLIIDHPMFAAKTSVYAWKHPEYFKPGNPGIVRKNNDGSYEVNENWGDLKLWNWSKLRELNYEPIFAPIRYWLEFGHPKEGSRLIRLDALHLAWNNGNGQLASGDEDGDHYVAEVTREIRKYGGVAVSEAYEGREPSIRKYGVITIPSNEWRRISDHDNDTPASPRFLLTADGLRNEVNQSFFAGDPLLVAVSAGHFQGPVYPEGAIKRMEGLGAQRVSVWDWRYPVESDEDYLDRVRFDLRPYVRKRIRLARAAKQGRVWQETDSLVALLVSEANRFIWESRDEAGNQNAVNPAVLRTLPGLVLAASTEESGRRVLVRFQKAMEAILATLGELGELLQERDRLKREPGDHEAAKRTLDERIKEKENELNQKGIQLYPLSHQMIFMRVLENYVRVTGDWQLAESMRPLLRKIMTRAALPKAQADFLYPGVAGSASVFMDDGGLLGTPATAFDSRAGKLVDNNARWYANLKFMEQLEMRAESGTPEQAASYRSLAGRVQKTFNERFWNPREHSLYDVIDGDGYDHGGAVRPYQIVAVSESGDLLSGERQEQVFARVEYDLYTDFGLRSLSPRDDRYRERVADDPGGLQGSVHPWLLEPYMEALVRVRRFQGRTEDQIKQEILEKITPLLEHFALSRTGALAQIFDGGPRLGILRRQARYAALEAAVSGPVAASAAMASVLDQALRKAMIDEVMEMPAEKTIQNAGGAPAAPANVAAVVSILEKHKLVPRREFRTWLSKVAQPTRIEIQSVEPLETGDKHVVRAHVYVSPELRPDDLTVQIWTHGEPLQSGDTEWRHPYGIEMHAVGGEPADAGYFIYEGKIQDRPGQNEFTVRAAAHAKDKDWSWEFKWAEGGNRRLKGLNPLWQEDSSEAMLATASNNFVRYEPAFVAGTGRNGTPEIWAAAPPSEWFHEQWGRDTFLSIIGNLVAVGRFEEAKQIFRFFAQFEVGGLLPNKIWNTEKALSEDTQKLLNRKRDLLARNAELMSRYAWQRRHEQKNIPDWDQGLNREAETIDEELNRNREEIIRIEKDFTNHGVDYNNADAPVWFIQAVEKYLKFRPSDGKFAQEMFPVMQKILDGYLNPKEKVTAKYFWRDGYHLIYTDQDGLLVTPPQGQWTDAQPEGLPPVTPRNGKVSGFNAAFYGTLRFAAEMAARHGNAGKAEEYRAAADRLKKSFNEKMPDPKFLTGEEIAPYFDVVEGDPHAGALRSDIVWLVSRGRDLIPEDRRVAVVMAATKYLLTPYGLRTLAPQDDYYKGDYRARQNTGNQVYKDEAYHQGTVWPWQIADYIDAVAAIWDLEAFRPHRREFLERIGLDANDTAIGMKDVAKKILTPLLEFQKNNWAKSLPEVFDGGSREDVLAGRPYHQEPGGTPSQSWSIASVIEAGIRYGVLDAKVLKWWADSTARPYGVIAEPVMTHTQGGAESQQPLQIREGENLPLRARVYIRTGIAAAVLEVDALMPQIPMSEWGKDWENIKAVSLTPKERNAADASIVYEGNLPLESFPAGKYEFTVRAKHKENKKEAWSGNFRIEILAKPAAGETSETAGAGPEAKEPAQRSEIRQPELRFIADPARLSNYPAAGDAQKALNQEIAYIRETLRGQPQILESAYREAGVSADQVREIEIEWIPGEGSTKELYQMRVWTAERERPRAVFALHTVLRHLKSIQDMDAFGRPTYSALHEMRKAHALERSSVGRHFSKLIASNWSPQNANDLLILSEWVDGKTFVDWVKDMLRASPAGLNPLMERKGGLGHKYLTVSARGLMTDPGIGTGGQDSSLMRETAALLHDSVPALAPHVLSLLDITLKGWSETGFIYDIGPDDVKITASGEIGLFDAGSRDFRRRDPIREGEILQHFLETYTGMPVERTAEPGVWELIRGQILTPRQVFEQVPRSLGESKGRDFLGAAINDFEKKEPLEVFQPVLADLRAVFDSLSGKMPVAVKPVSQSERMRSELRRVVAPVLETLAQRSPRRVPVQVAERLSSAVREFGLMRIAYAMEEEAKNPRYPLSLAGVVAEDQEAFYQEHPEYEADRDSFVLREISALANDADRFLADHPDQGLNYAGIFDGSTPRLRAWLGEYMDAIEKIRQKHPSRVNAYLRILLPRREAPSSMPAEWRAFLKKVDRSKIAKIIDASNPVIASLRVGEELGRKDNANALVYGLTDWAIDPKFKSRVVASDLSAEITFPVAVRLSKVLAPVSGVIGPELLRKLPNFLPGVVEFNGEQLAITRLAAEFIYRHQASEYIASMA